MARAKLLTREWPRCSSGRHHWHQRTASSLDRAIGYFSQALDRDPSLALAHSGLADAYLLKASYGDLSKKEAQILAAPSIERALELDPELADARASLGIMRLYEGSLELAEVPWWKRRGSILITRWR